MKRGIAVLVSVSALCGIAYFTASKWAIKHETITFYDASRDNRPVPVQIAVRRDKEMQANAGMILVSEAGWRLASGLFADSVSPELPSTMIEENAGL